MSDSKNLTERALKSRAKVLAAYPMASAITVEARAAKFNRPRYRYVIVVDATRFIKRRLSGQHIDESDAWISAAKKVNDQ